MDDILLDTNVISETIKRNPDPNVLAFLAAVSDPWISSITMHELAYGAERVTETNRRAKLAAWVASVAIEFAERTIVIDAAVADRSGRIRALASSRGKAVTVSDSLIAACAELSRLRIATRNTRDFLLLNAITLDPWAFKA